MSLTEEVTYDKEGHIERFPIFKKLFLSITIILVATLSFGIGRLSVAGKRRPIRIEYDPSISNSQFPISNEASVVSASINKGTGVITSKNGTKYHYTHCTGAKQIKEENKVVFESPTAAEAAGYTLAANCLPK